MISGLRAADGRGRHRAPASLGPELPLSGHQTKYESALCQTGNEPRHLVACVPFN